MMAQSISQGSLMYKQKASWKCEPQHEGGSFIYLLSNNIDEEDGVPEYLGTTESGEKD